MSKLSLYTKFAETENWKYYSRMPFENYENAISDPVNFIQTYFAYGGKSDLLLKSVYFADKERAAHVVNTYFLGLYLVENLPFLKPRNSLLSKDRFFLWAWFLCSLYHDAFFDVQDINAEEICYDYASFAKGLLYSVQTVRKYFDKNASAETSYDGQVHFDHGIVAASELYKRYVQILSTATKYGDGDISDFFTPQGVIVGDGVMINHETLDAACKISKIIACHNIFVCDDEREAPKYKACKLNDLIAESGKFHKMPHGAAVLYNDYERLYYLLCLTDVLEPSKRGIPPDRIDFAFSRDAGRTLLDITGEVTPSYKRNASGLEKWMAGIRVSGGGTHLEFELNTSRIS